MDAPSLQDIAAFLTDHFSRGIDRPSVEQLKAVLAQRGEQTTSAVDSRKGLVTLFEEEGIRWLVIEWPVEPEGREWSVAIACDCRGTARQLNTTGRMHL